MKKIIGIKTVKCLRNLCLFLLVAGFASPVYGAAVDGRPNVLWIVIEDASCHISCYGETAIETPNIDALAGEGVRFENAFTTAAVCSPVRSALVTGMYQTTSCSHNHRSQVKTGKGGGNVDYYESYSLPAEIPLASKLFEDAGYYTSNEKLSGETGKTDYNFFAENVYSGTTWKECPEGTPFFSQIQLKGGKNRSRVAETEGFILPPYYFEDEVMRADWKEYLGSWLDTDQDVMQIVADLKAAGVYDQTLIVLLTDHGVSHLRGKQFLYDEGTKVPLIVKFPGDENRGTDRADLVKHIDILPSSLAYAGIAVPENIQGTDLFASDYKEQEYIFTTRDRCDETTEIIRSVRTGNYKYIRNFLSYLPHAQRNQYKDGKDISRHTRELWESGSLNELQARFYQPTRPPEELYDLENDPFEINNLAGDPASSEVLFSLRGRLYEWMAETNDPVLIPEPMLEDLGKLYGNKYTAMKQEGMDQLRENLISIIESGEQQNNEVLIKAIDSQDPAERYWAVTWLGINRVGTAREQVAASTADTDPSVRIAANLALYKIDPSYDPIPALGKEVDHINLIVGMYAMSAIEQTGIRNEAVKSIAETAARSKYEFTKRYGNYLLRSCGGISQEDKISFDVRQLTSGPRHHFFGYVGHAMTIPWNQGDRYILSLRSDFYKRMPEAGESADVVMIDTRNNNEVIPLDKTYAWNLQQGTMFYWNPNSPEKEFFFNDLDPETGLVFTVLYDIEKRERIREYRFDNESIANGGVAPGGEYFAGINYGKITRSREVIQYAGAKDFSLGGPDNPESDGLFKVNIESGEKEMLVSYKALAEFLELPEDYPIYTHHTLWNRDNNRIIFVVRGRQDKNPNVGCVIHSDGSGLGLIEYSGHPEWYEGNLLSLPDESFFKLYNVDTKEVEGRIGEEGMFPSPGGDNAYSPDGKWYVGSHKVKSDTRGYAFYRMEDGALFNSPEMRTRDGGGTTRIDGAPRWNRASNAILVGGLDADGSRQLFVIRMLPKN